MEKRSESRIDRRTVRLEDYPDLVVLYLGMRVNALRGLVTLVSFGPKIARVAEGKPDGLLANEFLIYSLYPLHVGMRQYWRDFDSLEAFARAEPHRTWWHAFLRDPKGTGFWHETYFMKGGMEAVYVDVPADIGLRRFAPIVAAKGPMFSSRLRAGRHGPPTGPSVVSERELYG